LYLEALKNIDIDIKLHLSLIKTSRLFAWFPLT